MNTVLILNQDYTPLTICSVRRAFMLVFLQKADIISKVEKKTLKSVTQSFPFPSIIKVKHYANIPYKGVVMSRHNIFKRDGGKCQYCSTRKNLTIDHVIPKSKGGKSIWTNLVTACKKCNSHKSDSTLDEASMNLLKQPTKPSYVTFLQMNTTTHRSDWTTYLYPKKSIA